MKENWNKCIKALLFLLGELNKNDVLSVKTSEITLCAKYFKILFLNKNNLVEERIYIKDDYGHNLSLLVIMV